MLRIRSSLYRHVEMDNYDKKLCVAVSVDLLNNIVFNTATI